MARSMIARQNIKLNLVPGGVPPVLNVSQYDSAYDVHFTIYNGAQLFEIPDDVSIQFQETKRDGNGFTVGATKSAQTGQCYIWMQEQMSAVPGDQICELVLTNTTEDQIGTANFIMRVEPAALKKNTVISESEIAYANQVLAQLGSVAAYKEQLDAQGNEIDQLNTDLAAEVAARQAADNTLQSNINSEASKRATADAALQSQINQLIAPEGAAPSAAEIENARVGADGTVYPTLGDAIRTQDTQLKNVLSENTANLAVPNKSTVVNNVTFTDNGAEGISIIGTASSSGGRTRQITKPMTLSAGTYYVCLFANGSVPAIYVENTSGNAIITTVDYPNSVYEFTLASETTVYIGANVINGVVYNTIGAIIYLSATKPSYTNNVSAVDFIARKNSENVKYLKESSFYTLKEVFPFAVGAYNANTGSVSYNTRYRLVSLEKYTTHETIMVSMPDGYKFGIVFYDGNNRTDTGWITGTYYIPAGSTFLLQLAKTQENTSEVITDVKNSDLYRNLTFITDTEEQVVSPYDTVLPISTEQLSVTNPWSQGACLVGRKLVGFNASSDDHLTNGTARIYDADNNLTQIGSFGHNTGHASTADYCQRTDTMSVANGTYASGVIPTIYLVKNASAKIAAASDLLITDPDVIAFDVSNLTGQGVGACFGETDQFMYVMTLESASQYDNYPTKYIYKLLLGKGSNDMTSIFDSDNFGTFITGCGDNEYNGTAHLVASYSLEVYGELQGLKYRNGYLYMSCDTNKLTNEKTPYLAKIKLTEDAAELVDFYHIPNYSDTGNLLSAESEGFVFDGAVGYVTVFPSGNPSRTLRFNAII